MTVTAPPQSFGGSLLTLIWRNQLLNSAGVAAQRSSSSQPVPAPSTAEPISCGDLDEVRMANAVHTAVHYGFPTGPTPSQAAPDDPLVDWHDRNLPVQWGLYSWSLDGTGTRHV